MLNKEDFIKYLEEVNNHYLELGFDDKEDFEAFESGFGVSKITIELSSGTVCRKYYLYAHDSYNKTFFYIQRFDDLKLAEKALKALTTTSLKQKAR